MKMSYNNYVGNEALPREYALNRNYADGFCEKTTQKLSAFLVLQLRRIIC